MKTVRTHDKIYLSENYKNEPKEYYKECVSLIKSDKGGNIGTILDIGCETGSFLSYLRKEIPLADLYGMDIMQELLESLKADTTIDAKAIHADISDKNTLPNTHFDVVTMLGVIGIFEDFRPVIKNIVNLLARNGIAYIFGIFNPEDLDVLIKSKRSGCEEDKWETGWNLFSKKSIQLFCNDNNLSCEFIPFEIGIDIAKHEDDPLRSWTIAMPDNKRMIINGLQIIHRFYFLRIQKM